MAKILIAEDELILAMKTETDLTNMEHEIVGITDNSAKAVEIADKRKPDPILMDIVLKGSMNGIRRAFGQLCQPMLSSLVHQTSR